MEEQREAQPDKPMVPVEQSVKKPSPVAVWILVVVMVLVALLVFSSKKQLIPEKLTTVPNQANPKTLCYYESIPRASGYSDMFALKLTITDGTATGELITAPAEKDRMVGTLAGMVTAGVDELIFDGWYTNQAEGMNNVDERLIKLTDTQARIGYGESVVNADGSYSYKDATALNYSLAITRVDCAIYDQAITLRSQ